MLADMTADAQADVQKGQLPIKLAPFELPVLGPDTPALIDMGVSEATQNLRRVWAELAAGGAVRVLHRGGSTRRMPRVRAWFTAVPPSPDGVTEFQQISIGLLQMQLSTCLDQAARGVCFEVMVALHGGGTRKAGTVTGYLHTIAPECYRDVPLPVTETYSRGGRVPSGRWEVQPEEAQGRLPEPWERVRDAYRELEPAQRAKFRDWYRKWPAATGRRKAGLS